MKTKEYYIQLTERYFEAETTRKEELELREFLLTTDDADFNEVKAVMGLMSNVECRTTSKEEETKTETKPTGKAKTLHLWRYAAAAVVVIVLALVPILKGGDSDCVMFVNGERITDNQEVMAAMRGQMASVVSNDNEAITMESQMADMFN